MIYGNNNLQQERVLAYSIANQFTVEELMQVSGGSKERAKKGSQVGTTKNVTVEYTGPSGAHDVTADVNIDW